MKKQLFSLLLVASVLSACGPAAPQLGKDSVEDVIGAMVQQVLLIRYPVWEFLPLCWLMDLQVYV